jgi:hypothetical protein
MKTIKYIFLFVLCCTVFSLSQENPVNYFQGYFSVAVYNPSSNNTANGHVKFDFSEIYTSNNILDVTVVSNVFYNSYYMRYGYYNINWSFSQSYMFSSPEQFYVSADPNYAIKDVLFVKLRDGNYPKDVVIMRGDEQNGFLQIHLNINEQISPYSTGIPYAGGNNIDAGAFT